jgi:hypothetical protein
LGARLRGQLDTELLFDLEDAEALVSGQVGLYGNAGAGFNHFLARKWPGGVLAPNTLYQAELLASFPLFQAGAWPASPTDEGWLELTDNNARKRIITVGRDDWTDYRLETNFSIEDTDRAGFIVRFSLDPVTNEFECYRLFFNPQQEKLKLARLTGGVDPASTEYSIGTRVTVWECPDQSPLPGGQNITCNVDFNLDEHDLALTCVGDTFTIEIDGQLVAEVTEGVLDHGQAGLYYGGSETQPQFSQIVIRSAPRQPVYGWSFSTSAYQGLVEQLDTFNGQVYPEANTVGLSAFQAEALAAAGEFSRLDVELTAARGALALATPVETAQKRDAVLWAIDDRSQAASAHYEALYQLFFGDTYRPLPPVVELSEVVGSDGRYALFLESPEPLDWTRVATRVRRRNNAGDYVDIAVGVLAAWSEDGTRAFLMRDDGERIGQGTFEIQISQALDTVEGPVQRRNGSTLPEVGRLRITLE